MTTEETIRNSFQVEFAFWQSLRESYRAREIDLEELLLSWAINEIEQLESPGARGDFEELCNDGCLLQVLGVIVSLLRLSPSLGHFWSEMVGQPENRERAARDLEKVATTVESLFGGTAAQIPDEYFNTFGRTPPSRVVRELRYYASAIKSAEKIKADTRVHSPVEIAKYLLTSYVERITGRSHDRNVSSLIASVTGKPKYGEVDHRMWRMRNYERLDQHFSWVTRILFVATVVLVFSE